jgi:NAD(P)-dependent dehydrogenase (short-subunit alcohol dehydrogenase family)
MYNRRRPGSQNEEFRSPAMTTPSGTPFSLDGRHALVTGGASGIGEAICRVFYAAGASVIILDIDLARAEALAAELAGSTVVGCDITDEEAVKNAFAGVQILDVLVNNAGIDHIRLGKGLPTARRGGSDVFGQKTAFCELSSLSRLGGLSMDGSR